jgi:hypothetical protein
MLLRALVVPAHKLLLLFVLVLVPGLLLLVY